MKVIGPATSEELHSQSEVGWTDKAKTYRMRGIAKYNTTQKTKKIRKADAIEI